MRKPQKWLAVLLCVCLFVAFVFSLAATASHAGHACSGEHCEICLEIAHLQHTLKQFCAALSAAAFTLSATVVLAAIVKAAGTHSTGTLVSLKVQQNN